MEENQAKSRAVTRNEVKARLEGVKLEDMSAQDLFDRYIVYTRGTKLYRSTKAVNSIWIPRIFNSHRGEIGSYRGSYWENEIKSVIQNKRLCY